MLGPMSSPPAEAQSIAAASQFARLWVDRTLGSLPIWCIVSASMAGLFAWNTRHVMNPDGLSYLDVATQALHEGPGGLVNGYWSPGCPALISVALLLVRPAPEQEFPLLHAVNWLLFMLALWAFAQFFRAWRATLPPSARIGLLTALAFTTFLWFTLGFVGLKVVSPDLAVEAVVLLAAAITYRLSLQPASWMHYARLGGVLGVGYYVKAVLFPLGLALLGLLLLLPGGLPRRRLLIALAVFAAVCAPYIAIMSLRAHRPSYGEVGRLNYAWYVNGMLWDDGLVPPPPGSTSTLR